MKSPPAGCCFPLTTLRCCARPDGFGCEKQSGQAENVRVDKDSELRYCWKVAPRTAARPVNKPGTLPESTQRKQVRGHMVVAAFNGLVCSGP